MPKIKRETVVVYDKNDSSNRISCTFDINVDSEGTFYMRFSEEEIAKLKEGNIDLEKGYQRKEGYLTAPSMEALIAKVKDTWRQLMSRVMIDEKIVIKYAIMTQFSYAIGRNGEISPNGMDEWTGGIPDGLGTAWRQGNVDVNGANPKPFGMMVYVRPSVRKDYKYANGTIKTEYSSLDPRDEFAGKYLTTDINLNWLNSIACIAVERPMKIEEVEYTEQLSSFFVNMLKSLCMMNERMKDFLKPEQIIKLANSTGGNILLAPKEERKG